jgi:hypothetical protein
MSDENVQLILTKFEEFKTELSADLKADQAKLEKEWNEKFFQLSRDTLNFARNVIVTAAVVAVLAPLLKESLTFALELLRESRT